MRIALAQINSNLANLELNKEKILTAIQRAKDWHCDLIVFPESTVLGYPPSDLLEQPEIVESQLKVLKQIHKLMPKGIAALVGAMTKNKRPRGRPYFNSAALLEKGKAPKFFHKQLLPIYDVFDEGRHLERGKTADNIFSLNKKKILVTICEDIWAWPHAGTRNLHVENQLEKIKGKFDLVVNLSASPWSRKKLNYRFEVVGKTAKKFRAPMVYVNQVGAQDDIVFDGNSFAVDSKGREILRCSDFSEDIAIFDTKNIKNSSPTKPSSEASESLRKALVLGIRDFCAKTGIQKVHLGLSGGIDSAVVACLAVDAVGPSRVEVFALPSQFNDSKSERLAKELASNLKIKIHSISIEPVYAEILRVFEGSLGEKEFSLMNENLQSRIRGLLLMAFANREGSLLLATGNKSEFATGYSTLYGDMCGGLAPIGDLLKCEVYELAKYYNREFELIPEDIITRAPSAELRPNQKDQDSLPEYDLLDSAVRNIVEKRRPAKTQTEKWLLEKLVKSEFKRWQAPPILRVSDHAFGRGRRMPIARK